MKVKWTDGSDFIEATGSKEFVEESFKQYFSVREQLYGEAARAATEKTLRDELKQLFRTRSSTEARIREIETTLKTMAIIAAQKRSA